MKVNHNGQYIEVDIYSVDAEQYFQPEDLAMRRADIRGFAEAVMDSPEFAKFSDSPKAVRFQDLLRRLEGSDPWTYYAKLDKIVQAVKNAPGLDQADKLALKTLANTHHITIDLGA